MPEESFRLVLNGGKTEMNSATIPIRWFFEESLFSRPQEEKPGFILLIEKTKAEAENRKRRGVNGRRYLFEVSDVMDYIQIFSPGEHVITAFWIPDILSIDEHLMRNYLSKDYRNQYYEVDIFEDGSFYPKNIFIQEFSVPNELFAEKPKTKLGEIIWEYVNLLYKKEPIDECDYRKRKILAFTVFVPFEILLLLFFVLAAIIGTICRLLGGLLLLLFGFFPFDFLDGTIDLIKDPFESTNWKVRTMGRMRVMPIEILGVLLYIYTPYLLITKYPNWFFTCLLIFVSAVWLIILLINIVRKLGLKSPNISSGFLEKKIDQLDAFLDKKNQQRLEKRIQRKIAAYKLSEERILAFNQEMMGISNFRQEAKPKEVISRVGPKRKMVIQFWAIKAKVCKPFAR